MKNNNKPSSDFKPYVEDDTKLKEMTPVSITVGVIIAVVFGAANAYLGLRVGMTISASIPAAVISMCIIRKVLKRNSILENNMVQTIGSAGEAVAGGAIFTFPALFLWAQEGAMEEPGFFEIGIVALIGGALGVLFMIPLRHALIVKEHGILPYPEGTACAEVLLSGEKEKGSSKSVFAGMGLAALIKLIIDGFKSVAGVITIPIRALHTEFSLQTYPSLIAVGYICGIKISSLMFAGSVIGFFVLIPAIVLFGGDTIMFPGTDTIGNIYASGGASAIWANYIRYIGAGAVAMAGLISLAKSLPMIVKTFIGAIKGIKNSTHAGMERRSQDLDIRIVVGAIGLLILLIWLLPTVPIGLSGAIIVAVMGFFFGAVSSRMVGIVGSSNCPVSGMTIATLLIATTVLKFFGDTGAHGMKGAIIIGSVICIIAGVAGDTSQDLKTGYILGATPKKQQIGEIIGAGAAALAIGGVMVLLNSAWGFGSAELSAPQATLMKMIIEGIMDGNLPWGLIFIGAFISVAAEVLGISSLALAIGLYLPFEISSTIMVGGIIRHFIDKKRGKSADNDSGILFCSGIIAGEGLIGILLALLTVIGVDKYIDLSGCLDTGAIGGAVVLVALVVFICKFSLSKKSDNE